MRWKNPWMLNPNSKMYKNNSSVYFANIIKSLALAWSTAEYPAPPIRYVKQIFWWALCQWFCFNFQKWWELITYFSILNKWIIKQKVRLSQWQTRSTHNNTQKQEQRDANDGEVGQSKAMQNDINMESTWLFIYELTIFNRKIYDIDKYNSRSTILSTKYLIVFQMCDKRRKEFDPCFIHSETFLYKCYFVCFKAKNQFTPKNMDVR